MKKPAPPFRPLSSSDFNDSLTSFTSYLSTQYLIAQKRALKSKLIFVSLNLATFIMSTIIVILTLFIIGKRWGGTNIIAIFTALSIVSATITFVVGLGSLFQFKKRHLGYQQQIAQLKAALHQIQTHPDLDRVTDVQKLVNSITNWDSEL